METFSGFLGTSVQERGWGRTRQLCPVWPVAAQGPCKPASVMERNALGPPHPPGQGCPCPWSSPRPQARQAGWQSSDHVLAPGEPPPLMQPEGWGAGTAQGRVGVKSLRSGQGLAGGCRAAGWPSVSSLAAHPSPWRARGPAHLPRPSQNTCPCSGGGSPLGVHQTSPFPPGRSACSGEAWTQA